MRRTLLTAVAIMLFGSLVLTVSERTRPSISWVLEHFGTAIITAGLLGAVYETFFRESEFLRIDLAHSIEETASRLGENKRRHPPYADPSDENALPFRTVPPIEPTPSTFESYYIGAVDRIVRKADVADEKASTLLTKGVRYSQFGILLYIVAIVSWQYVERFWSTPKSAELHAATILGVVSSSILFIFIEFLAAWFLKQYRHFVDTSTYLMKVKSTLDRYMLTYLLVKDRHEDTRYAELLALLARDISWPDAVSPDGSYASEAMQSLSAIVASVLAKEEKPPKKE